MLLLIEKGAPLWYCEECFGSWFDDSEIAFGHDCEKAFDDSPAAASYQGESLKALRWVSDSSHGWLEVPLSVFPSAIDFGTGFGYINEINGLIYLEEDCEAVEFLKSIGALWEVFPEFKGDFVRALPRNENRAGA